MGEASQQHPLVLFEKSTPGRRSPLLRRRRACNADLPDVTMVCAAASAEHDQAALKPGLPLDFEGGQRNRSAFLEHNQTSGFTDRSRSFAATRQHLAGCLVTTATTGFDENLL